MTDTNRDIENRRDEESCWIGDVYVLSRMLSILIVEKLKLIVYCPVFDCT